jgi:hypothetical protein
MAMAAPDISAGSEDSSTSRRDPPVDFLQKQEEIRKR